MQDPATNDDGDDDFYEAPPWSQSPSPDSGWKLTEIKSGMQLAEYDLTKKRCTVLGRAADAVDVVLNHPSCSRQHARIAFDASGTAWLRDLRSTHGSTVNKKPVPDEASGKDESNSNKPGARGVVVYPGDVLQFGASTRLFCIEGPDQKSRTAVAAAAAQKKAAGESSSLNGSHQQRESAVASSEHTRPTDARDDDGGGISWGIDMGDYHAMPDSDTAQAADLTSMESWDDDKVPDKHRKEWEKLKVLKYKLGNIQSESERIRRKQSQEELSDGQQRQLERNQERLAALQEDIREREGSLWKKLNPNANLPSSSKRLVDSGPDVGGGIDDDEEEVEDRTAKRTSIIDRDGESEETLTRKWKDQFSRFQRIQAELMHAGKKASQLQQRASFLEVSGDEEAFFARNEYDLAMEKVKKLDKELETLKSALGDIEQLLMIANPKLTIDREKSYVGVIPPSRATESDQTEFLPPPPRRRPSQGNGSDWVIPKPLEDGGFVVPAPRPPTNAVSAVDSDANRDTKRGFSKKTKTESCDMLPPPPPKRKRALGPSLPPSTGVKRDARVPVAPGGTLAMLAAASSTDPFATGHCPEKTKNRGVEAPKVTGDSSKRVKTAAISVDPTTDVWQAPKDQDGSGRTKLNEKFAGRY